LGGGPFVQFGGSGTHVKTIAAFADVTYQVIDNLFLTAGLRYSHDVFDDSFYLLGPAVTGTPGVIRVDVPNLKDDRVTPRFVIRYKPNDNSSIYASYTQGYKSAFVNVGGQTSDIVAPEEIKAYEVGYKYGSNRLSLDLSAYYYDYSQLQVASYDGQRSLVSNAATSRVYGLEGQVFFRITPNWDVSAGAAYLDAKYESFPNSPSLTQCLDAACGPGFGLFLNTVTDASGFRMQRSPEFTGNISTTYRQDLAGGQLVLTGVLSHTSSFYFDTSQQFGEDGYQTLGLRAEWTDPTERYTFAVYGDNVTDTKYRATSIYGTFGVGALWGAPATVGASVRARF